MFIRKVTESNWSPRCTWNKYWSEASSRCVPPFTVYETDFWLARNAEREEFILGVQNDLHEAVPKIMQWDRSQPKTTPRKQLEELGFEVFPATGLSFPQGETGYIENPPTQEGDFSGWTRDDCIESFLDFTQFYRCFKTDILLEYPNEDPVGLSLGLFEGLDLEQQKMILGVLYRTLDDVIPDIVPRTGADEMGIGSYQEYVVVGAGPKDESRSGFGSLPAEGREAFTWRNLDV